MPSLDSLFSIEYVVTNSSSPLPAHLETQLGHIRVDPGLCKVHVCQGYRGDILGGVDHSVSGWTEIISPTPESVQPLTESGPTCPIDSCAMVRKSHELKTIYSREQPIDYGESTLTSRLWCIRDRVVYCPCFQCPFSPTWIPSIPNAVRDAWQSSANTSWREANSFDQSEFCLQPS